MKRRQFLVTLAAGALSTGAAVRAATYPNRPVRLVVPFPPGGNVDTVARIISPRLAAALGEPVVIENRGGASGMIGSERVARSEADGHTLLIAGSNHGINPSVYRKLPYDTLADFAPVGLIGSVPLVLVTSQDLPVRNYAELIEYGQRNRGVLKFGITSGAANHLATALLIKQAGINAVMVPYKGDGPTITDLLGGHINAYIGISSLLRQYVESGRLPAMAVTSAERVPLFPTVPTLIESGLRDYVVGSWNGIFAPTGTPSESMHALHAALHETLRDGQVRAKLAGLGMNVVNGDQDALASFVSSEVARWTAVVADAGIERQ
ncbi:tripartite tricarboxylate transporter family receptor [Bordetella bronchiseptica MBORD762]|uniref:Bug family tripartite tricarboxylate transporter substrate binding protein n=1 Tax=Bordetella bronchiseptica TaxID=518 RepID=UPI000460B1D4|nr:tripartite tricarboxylate transporter substrate binding protein [Bordetella bronchiseptica]KDD85422.1 tripartite tricarboxylate transporter family receptor [Bordetella bronchiseptica MBORD762]